VRSTDCNLCANCVQAASDFFFDELAARLHALDQQAKAIRDQQPNANDARKPITH
jgi:hypothetical protein